MKSVFEMESEVANKVPGDIAIRIICGQSTVAIELSDCTSEGEILEVFKTIFMEPARARALGVELIEAARRIEQ